MKEEDNMIVLENVGYKVFDEKTGEDKEILKDINLSFEDNKITVITGHNGSGKSTLVKLIMGLIKPTSGRILLNKTDLTEMSVTERANCGITLAFQQPVKFKGLTVKNLIEIASEKSTSVSDACDYLSAVGLCAREYLQRELDSTLSGGELKRIELALALAKGGNVFLFDEPEAGIDLWSFDDLVGIFKKLKHKTVIIVSHQKKILDIADNVLLLTNDGYEYGKKKQIEKLLVHKRCVRLK